MALLLDTKGWKEFHLTDLFEIVNCIPHDIGNLESGSVKFIGRTASNNGAQGFVIVPQEDINNGQCISLSRVATNIALWQPEEFTTSQHITTFRSDKMNLYSGLFICTVMNQYMDGRFSYGRTIGDKDIKDFIIKLPATPSGEPDWQFMEDYIKSLHHKPLTTKNKPGKVPALNVQNWKYYQLHDLCTITMGNKMDFSAMNTDEPAVNFVGRSAENNGIMGKVDFVLDDNGQRIKPYPAGCITIALGGSLGSTYLQREPFYTSQNVSVIEFDESVSDYAKLFMCTLIHNESLYKYFPFGRELNTHIRTDFGFTLPVDVDGNPDWQFMEDYIKALPYGDRI